MRRSALLLFATTLLAASARGQAEPLTLEQALTLAAGQHEIPRIAEARLAQAKAIRSEALAALFPSFTLFGTYKRAPGVTVQTGNTERIIQRENALNGQAVLQATLFDAQAFNAVGRISKSAEAAAIEAKDLERTFAFDVAESYFAVLAADELAKAAEARVELAQQGVTDAKARLDAGLGDRSALTRAELELAAARVARASTLGGRQTALAALSALVGKPVSEVAETNALALPEDDPETLVRQRPDLLAAELRTEAARAAKKEPWLSLIPTLGLRAAASATNESGFVGNTNWNVAATMTWVLFDGGLRYARAAARSAELDEAMAGADLLRRNAALEVQVASARLGAAEAAVKEASVQTELARRNAAEIDTRFKAGFATALERADASSAAYLAGSDLARQRFAVRSAQLALLEALGRWPSEGTSKP